MAYNEISLPNDPLLVVGVLPVGTTIDGKLDFPVGGGPTAGSVTLRELGVPIPAETFTGFTSSLSGTTYTLTSANNALNQRVVITYDTTTPNVAKTIQVQQQVPIIGTYVTIASATNATVIPNLNVPCFASGTLIRTSRGEVAVEDLRVGDMVETTSGKLRPIVWLGNTEINGRIVAHPIAYQPIRIAADALAPGMPYTDLTVSPGLCVKMLDEVIVRPVAPISPGARW